MASLIKRSDGRFELRESAWTEAGPRSRTLAIFRDLTPEVLDRAQSRANGPFDRTAVLARARRLGLHVKQVLGSSEVADLVGRVRSEKLWPTQAAAANIALERLPVAALPHHLEAMIDWLGADDADRGRALVDLLRLADTIERARTGSKRGALRFPRLADCAQ